MNLCIAHIDTERGWRGGEQQVFSLIKGLAQRGHKNVAFVKRGQPLASRLRAIGCDIVEINPWSEFGLFSAGWMSLQYGHYKTQIVHAHNAHGVALAALSTLRNPIPFVLTRRVDFPVASNPLSWWKYNRAAKIISISEAVSHVLKTNGIAPKKIVKVHSGVDFNRYENVSAVSKPDMDLPKDSFVIGQVAALAPHKDQSTFLKAMKILSKQNPRVRAVLVGAGPLERQLKKQAASLGLNSVVRFAGFQAGALRWLKGFDVFCLSSKEEGLGTSVIDAMALGVPVVATNAGGIPEMVEDGVTGYLAPAKNPEALADVLGKAMSNRRQMGEMIRRAKKRAEDFDISTTIAKTEAVYRSILAHS